MSLTVQKLNTLTQKVQYCLENYKETRNSDIDLSARLCENFYPPFERPLYNWRDLAHAMHSVPSLDHIARARRKIIQLHKYKKYLPTVKSIALARGYNEQVWKEYAIQNDIKEPVNTASNIPAGYNDEGEIVSHAR